MILDSAEEMKKLDRMKVLDDIERFPEQCEEAIKIGRDFSKGVRFRKTRSVCICGMGGSAIAGDFIASLFAETDVKVFRGYDIPKYVNGDYLVFVISYSGNTEETLSMFREAVKRECKIIAITTGGELELLCSKNSIPCVKIPEGIKPRFAFAYLFFPMLKILEKLKFLKITQKPETIIKHLKETREEIKLDVPVKHNVAKRIALKLNGSIPVMHCFGEYEPMGYRAKTQFNENSKLLSFNENFPELNHNSILAWEEPSSLTRNISAILVRNEKESEKTRKRINFTKNLMKKSARNVIEIWSLYPSKISRVLSTMYVLDFVSVYLAFLNNRDPGDDSLLAKLKTILKK